VASKKKSKVEAGKNRGNQKAEPAGAEAAGTKANAVKAANKKTTNKNRQVVIRWLAMVG
jgi:hypothetical protein